ncbi:filamentous hemagglutinin N-terminal domain-containing protein, partial [Acinetobacter portensis]
MNKNFYKTIFSKTRGEMVVVAENVSAEGQTSNRSTTQVEINTESTAEKSLGLKVLSFSIMLLTGVASLGVTTDLAQANVVADPNAAGNQRPTIINSANGTTQVNIQTPSQAGVSMNHYQQFDVNQKGVILNNSRQNAQTQLAGHIQGNPWLAGGEAKVIVNQVNSTNASHLNGYIEVGGRKADVIIANPAGINVDGGGFINAGGVTLTTGNPLLNNGAVTGFQIRDGLINITGQGLDTSTADYTRLLSHAAQMNAGVWAKDLQVVTGQNDIDIENNIKHVGATNSGTANTPKFSIDTGSLGGMYAGKISLISTDKGVGINNAGQVFASAGSIKIGADGQLQNSGAVVAQHKEDAKQATLDIKATDLNNSGSISSLAKQSIQTNKINNTGLIATSAELNIRNKETIQNQGELNAGRIDVETKELKNSTGKIVQTGLQDLAIDAKTLNNKNKGLIGYTEIDQDAGTDPSTGTGGGNTGGSGTGIEAPSTATGGGSTSSANTPITASFAQGKIKADSIENDAGKITANGGVDLSTAKTLDNTATLNLNTLSANGDYIRNHGVLSSTTLTAQVRDVDNNAGEIYSQNAAIQAEQLNNQKGIIQAQDRLNFNVQKQLNNQAGQITAINAVKIHDDNQNTLNIDNTKSGKILSTGDISLQSKKLQHAEQSLLIANKNIYLKQQGALSVDSAIQAGQDLVIENQSDIINNTVLEAGQSLSLSAQNIKNNDQGKVQANQLVHISARDKIENTGLINSQGLTLLDAKNEIKNIGTGQIYGDHIALQTQHLLNAEQQTNDGLKAGTIAARKRVDIAATKIENREQALISSEDKLVIGAKLNENNLAEGSAKYLDNASARIQSNGDMYLDVDTLTNRNLHFSSSVKEIPGTRKEVTAYQGDGRSEILDSSHVTGWGGKETVYLDGQEFEDYTRYNYTEYEKKDYVDSSAPAEIISGGTLGINGQNLTNDKSQILAAKGINILQNEINNIDADGEHRLIKTGTSRYHYVGWNKLGTSKRSKWNSTRAYNPADIVTPIKLDVVKYDGAYQGGVNSTQIEAVKRENVEGKTQTEIRSITPDLSLPSQSLFSINKDNNNRPLIETNDAFTNYKKWLGSDYMLKMFSTDPQNMHKRLGDGYYEQKLVNDQIAKLTGKVYLDGYSNYEDQFKALMDSGISTAKDLNLSIGVKLSEAQIARLTSDIVWLVKETVTLADGEKVQVLVPKVYVAVQPGDLNGQGTLIAADHVNIKLTGNLNNHGSIAGRQLVNLEANNINNVGGLIKGNEVFATAKTDINNIGGQIEANKALVLDAGRDINNITTTIKTENKDGLSEFTAENIGRVAGLYVNDADGQLIANAKNNINLKASDIRSEGGVAIHAGKDLNVSTVNVSRSDLSSAGEKDQILNASSRDVGTQIQSKGDISLKSDDNTHIKAGTLNSESGNVVIDAGKDVLIENGRDERSSELAAQEKGGFSKTDKKIKSSTSQSIATDIQAGGNVLINSQEGDVQATHLIAEAKESIQISANKGNVKLISDIDTDMKSNVSEKKNAVQFENRQSGYIDEEVAQTQLKAGKNVDINAGKNIELQANDIQAKDNIYIGNTQFERQADGSLKSRDGSAIPENVSLTTLETNDQQWDEKQKGYRGVAKDLMKATAIGLAGIEGLAPGLKAPKITIGESSSTRTEQSKQTGTDLAATNINVGSSEKTQIKSANINAKNTVISGKKVELDAAEEQQKTVTSNSKETVEGLGVKLNKDSIRVGGFVLEDTEHEVKTTTTTHKSGTINTENLTIQGTEGVDILGQNITASGDTVIDHGRGDLNIGGYENKTTTEEKTHTETVSTEVGVRNAYVDAVLAVAAIADATKALSKAKDDYSQAQRDYAAGKITKEALDDSKANIAFATANVTSAQIAVAAAAATAAA